MFKISINKKKLAFMVLIGGKSARFGEDKGIFEFMGKPLISYQLEIIVKYNHDIFLVAHTKEQVQEYINKIRYEEITGFIIDDDEIASESDLRTPMIGIYSGLKELAKLGYEKSFVLSCDMPLIKARVIELLLKKSEDSDCVIPRWENDFLEPLFAIYPVQGTLRMAEENIRKRSFKLTNLLDNNWRIKYISIEKEIKSIDKDLLTLININGPIDLDKLMEYYKNK